MSINKIVFVPPSNAQSTAEIETDPQYIELAKVDPESVKIFKYIRSGNDGTCNFVLDKYLISLLQKSAFFATISRFVKKYECYEIDTACMAYDKNNEEFTLLYNPKYMQYCLSQDNDRDSVVCFTLIHEFYHLILEHVTSRFQSHKSLWNAAADCAINSLLESSGNAEIKMYRGGFLPGKPQTYISGNPILQFEPGSIVECVNSFPKEKASEWYYNRLLQESSKNNWEKGNEEGDITFEVTDADGNTQTVTVKSNHGGWGQCSDEEREFINEKVKNMIEKAVKIADQSSSNGWGHVPAHMRNKIRAYISKEVDWETLLKNFVGKSLRGNVKSSWKRISKRYPMIHAGKSLKYTPRVLIAIDQSGSVGDNDQQKIFSVLGELSNKTTFDVIPFDCGLDEKDLFTWKKGKKLNDFARIRCGGTDFDAPTQFVNDPKNVGRWDALIICTDGEAAKPVNCRIPRAYVIVPNRKLLFSTSDITITMNNNEKKTAGPVY